MSPIWCDNLINFFCSYVYFFCNNIIEWVIIYFKSLIIILYLTLDNQYNRSLSRSWSSTSWRRSSSWIEFFFYFSFVNVYILLVFLFLIERRNLLGNQNQLSRRKTKKKEKERILKSNRIVKKANVNQMSL